MSCELACDMARPITARSGALPGKESGIRCLSPVSPPRLGPVEKVSVGAEEPHSANTDLLVGGRPSLTGGESCIWRSWSETGSCS